MANLGDPLTLVELTDNLVTGWAPAGSTATIVAISITDDNTGGQWTINAALPVANSSTALIGTAASLPSGSDTTFRVVVEYLVDDSALDQFPIENTANVIGTDTSGVQRQASNTDELPRAELVILKPQLVVLKTITDVRAIGLSSPQTYEADVMIEVQNGSAQDIYNTQVVDDLEPVFGVGNVTSVTTPVVSGALALGNGTYNGIGDNNLLVGTETLEAFSSGNAQGVITFTVQFTNQNPFGTLDNKAVATAEDVFSQPLMDMDTANIVLPALPSIDVKKTVVSITPISGEADHYEIRFLVVVTNDGDVTLTDVQASDDLAQRLDDTTTSIVQIVENQVDVDETTLIQPLGAGFSTNNFFRADIQNPFLFPGSDPARKLHPGEAASVEFTAVIDSNGYEGLLDNKVVAEANSNGLQGRDVMDMDVVDIEISATYELTLDKSLSGPVITVGPNQFDVPFRITVTNTGTRALANVALVDDLANQLPAGITLDGITAGPTINAGLSQTIGSSLALNGGFTGAGNDDLFDETGFLQDNDVYVIDFTARVTRSAGQATFVNAGVKMYQFDGVGQSSLSAFSGAAVGCGAGRG